MSYFIRFRIFLKILLSIYFLSFFLYAASNKTEKNVSESIVQVISNVEKFDKILASSGGNLLLFDLYADWCMPCRMLSPILETIAKEHKKLVTVYKINVDKNPDIARAFGVSGIPYVVFVKNKKGVHAMTGVMPKNAYVRAIKQFSETEKEDENLVPDGEIVNGIRTIKLSTAMSPGTIHVYRGEKVKIIIEKIGFEYSVHIPEYGISKKGVIGNDLEIVFKANEIGVFPLYCNGNCPTGDGAHFAQIMVMQYKAEGNAKFAELSAKEAKKLIENKKAFVLDVRTPNEFYEGHIKNAVLIPVSQLSGRLSEIEKYKDKDILVYCRSGNRSTVASEIMIQNGYKNLYNLRRGIKGWIKEGLNVVK